MFVIIAAIGQNRELGYQGNLIWKIKKDQSNFKNTTLGKRILMGRKTYESLPKKPLLGRNTIIVSKNNNYSSDLVETISDVSSFINQNKNTDEKIYICGGAKIYETFLPFCKQMLLTEINASFEHADTFFPMFNKEDWNTNVLYKGCDLDYYSKKFLNFRIVEYSKHK